MCVCGEERATGGLQPRVRPELSVKVEQKTKKKRVVGKNIPGKFKQREKCWVLCAGKQNHPLLGKESWEKRLARQQSSQMQG